MSSNFAEFVKVFLVVFTFSGLILSVRNLMIGLEEPNEVKDEDILEVSDVVQVATSDTMDYDGMGNYGRFPSVNTKE
tara:strand:- start:167 stop:397 length:231 start_codon:yes stop_codon:yes gene_type:complete